MHELSIAMALVEQLEEIRLKERGERVLSVTLRVGDLSGVDHEALTYAFPAACEGTACEGARLVIERVEAHARCRACGRESRPKWAIRVCETCGSRDVDMDKGCELLLQAVEVKDQNEVTKTGDDHVS